MPFRLVLITWNKTLFKAFGLALGFFFAFNSIVILLAFLLIKDININAFLSLITSKNALFFFIFIFVFYIILIFIIIIWLNNYYIFGSSIKKEKKNKKRRKNT